MKRKGERRRKEVERAPTLHHGILYDQQKISERTRRRQLRGTHRAKQSGMKLWPSHFLLAVINNDQRAKTCQLITCCTAKEVRQENGSNGKGEGEVISQGKDLLPPNNVMDTTDYRNEVYPGVREAGKAGPHTQTCTALCVTRLVSCLEALQKTGLFLSVVRLSRRGITHDR